MATKYFYRLNEACRIAGFDLSVTKEGKEYIFNLSCYTKQGQDVQLEFTLKNPTDEKLRKEVDDLYENYDPDREAYIWLDDDGHGKNGAPYRMRDVLDDMESVEARLKILSEVY